MDPQLEEKEPLTARPSTMLTACHFPLTREEVAEIGLPTHSESAPAD